MNNWKEGIKGQSIWINTILEERKEINSRKRICLLITTTSLNDLLGFSINLIEENIYQEFGGNETKVSILNFKIDVFI